MNKLYIEAVVTQYNVSKKSTVVHHHVGHTIIELENFPHIKSVRFSSIVRNPAGEIISCVDLGKFSGAVVSKEFFDAELSRLIHDARVIA